MRSGSLNNLLTVQKPINCDLKIFNRRGEIPKYEALSYVWGAGLAVHEAQVEGKSFYTRPNLHNAIRNWRQHNSTSIFWIDAICIDQSNDREKSEQFRRMAEIYQIAQSVVVWLGEKDSSHGAKSLGSLVLATAMWSQDSPQTYRDCPRYESPILYLS